MIEQLGIKLLSNAVEANSSDVHILPETDHYKVVEHRLGKVVPICQLSRQEGQQLIAHFKYRANMAITETRRPQLGALTLEIAEHEIHLRLSSVGNFLNQESLVIRLLRPLAQQQLAFLKPAQLHVLTNWCQHRGLVLFAGPTGSGKTTTIYQLAQQLSQALTVLSIEDPVEIVAPNFLQLQVNEAATMTYQALIKVALRHRPDVLIVGEIRDRETAQAAIDAALSGHLVLSTVHAQTAHGIVTRLSQLAIDPDVVKQAVIGVAYQRLIPTMDGQVAALLDLAAGPVDDQWQQVQETTAVWKEDLADAKRTDKISQQTYDQFKAG